ncbi:selenocysteine-specific translation elongation factor [Peribacillus deserti]|uniref:Selenocysteine-specific elongation factor n=1 Tax=Peribacillus deserti TaxID=673318 RepID=A0A2N5M2I4_9BACI|nr:selenocysteine-specific translation elongation factor [Peribacillus deserti]PLT28483.1 selenocysteine-specific translation elongation factor [Peribacillus deserti]
MKKHFTIGMAGHIDHGKTSLTKALTNVDTDQLKEEKERQISIELGFAPLYEDDKLTVSIVDVPGHERFIRQMIAGVAGIQLVILVVAADEGVMPQTKEHLEILQFLGVKKGIVAITKIDKVDPEFQELVQEEIALELEGSIFENSPVINVDSLSNKGIDELTALILKELETLEVSENHDAFRMPIDQVFTVKGHGTVVRGTVYNGSLREGETLYLIPKRLVTRARQLQVHNKQADRIFAGQRAAVNLGGLSNEEVVRGDVLVSTSDFQAADVIDVALSTTQDLTQELKQRMPIKCYIGTSEVMGKIIFFDRNELGSGQEGILCQLRLDREIAARRGDRFILRRPSPAETIGGGWVIDPAGGKYRFGKKTIEQLIKKKEGSPADRVLDAIKRDKGISKEALSQETSLSAAELDEVLADPAFISYRPGHVTHYEVAVAIQKKLKETIADFHKQNSLKTGINKAELVSDLVQGMPKELAEYLISNGEEKELWIRKGSYLSSAEFVPHIPSGWCRRSESMIEAVRKDRLKVRPFKEYFTEAGLPQLLEADMMRFYTEQNILVPIDDQLSVHVEAFNQGVQELKKGTAESFEVGEAKDILGLSRKHIIPYLEKLDEVKFTRREGNIRIWVAGK